MFSIIVPIYNEEENLRELVKEIYTSLWEYKDFELLIVNDCSNDNTEEVLSNLKINYKLKILTNSKNKGQSFSIHHGIANSKFETIITIDGDGQNNPNDIPKLIKIYFSDQNLHLVGGIRSKRKDSIVKILSSKIANYVRSKILKDNCRDTGCSLKIFNKKLFLQFPYFDGMHRFLPALFKGFGYETKFVNVDHRSRIKGISKYGTIDRLFKGIADMIKVRKIIMSNKVDSIK